MPIRKGRRKKAKVDSHPAGQFSTQEERDSDAVQLEDLFCDVCRVAKAAILCSCHTQGGGMVFCNGCDRHAHTHESTGNHMRFLLITKDTPVVEQPAPTPLETTDSLDYLQDLMNFASVGNAEPGPARSEEEAGTVSPAHQRKGVKPAASDTTEISDNKDDQPDTTCRVATCSNSNTSSENPLNRPISPTSHLYSDATSNAKPSSTVQQPIPQKEAQLAEKRQPGVEHETAPM